MDSDSPSSGKLDSALAEKPDMSRALLVIDVQQEYFDGALPITHPAGHLESILRVMDLAADHRVPTVVIRHHQADPESPIFRKDSEMWQLHAEVQSRPHDALIDKQFPGSFTGTELQSWLKQNNIDTIGIAGYMTQMCCDTTARQAFHRGYKVEFLRDATGTLTVENEAGRATAEELQNSILVAQQMFISEVIDSDTWASRLS
jgi:nicotinamidase-related amidase